MVVNLSPENEQRLESLAARSGRSKDDVLQSVIEHALEDLEDISVATDRMESPGRRLTMAEARRALGLGW